MGTKPNKKGKAFTRRDFLKGFGGGALGAAVVPRILAQESTSIATARGKIPVYTRKQISLDVNGKKYTLVVKPHDTLLEVLRDNLNLTGTKKTCDRGECGGCTVLLNEKPVYSCLYLAIRADGMSVQTVEGLSDGKDLHPVQQAYIDEDAYQCGFCTPGFLMASTAFLKTNSNPDLEGIKKALSGNICRCGNYQNIYKAVSAAAKKMGRS